MVRAIIFDNDGVLIDSVGPGMRRFREAAAQAGLTVPEETLLYEHNGTPWEKYLPKIGATVGWSNDDIRRFEEAYHNLGEEIYQSFPGVNDTLATLSAMQVLLFIVSNRHTTSLYKVLEAAGIEHDRFLIIQGFDDYEFHKPDPRVFNHIVADCLIPFGVAMRDILYVGDTVTNDLAAAQAHVPTITFVGVTSGTVTYDAFLAAGLEPMRILATVTHLPEVLFLL